MKPLFLILLLCLTFSNTSLFAQSIIKVIDSDKILEHTKEKKYLDSIYCWGYDTLNFRANYLYHKLYEIVNEWIIFYGCASPKTWEVIHKQGNEYQSKIFSLGLFAQDSFSIEILQLEKEIQETIIQKVLNEYAVTHQIGFIIDIENLHYFKITDDITSEIIAIIEEKSLNSYVNQIWYSKVQTLIKTAKKRLKLDISSTVNWD